MNKREFLDSSSNIENKLLLSKVWDKKEQCERNREIVITDFLDPYQQKTIEKALLYTHVPYLFYGGYAEANRCNLIFYPDEYTQTQVIQNYGKFVKVLRIVLPKTLQAKYQHRDYLGSVIKLGIKREKTGDILCDETGADILVQTEMIRYLSENLPSLTRFAKAKFEILLPEKIKIVEIRKKEVIIIVSSLRMDNVIAELLGISRTKANELLEQKRVFINYQNETKNTKLLKVKDIVIIRGKGKYEFENIEGQTKKNRYILKFLQYI